MSRLNLDFTRSPRLGLSELKMPSSNQPSETWYGSAGRARGQKVCFDMFNKDACFAVLLTLVASSSFLAGCGSHRGTRASREEPRVSVKKEEIRSEPKVPEDQRLPACLRQLDLNGAQSETGLREANSETSRKFCGLPGTSTSGDEGPGYGWLKAAGRDDLKQLHRNLDRYRSELAGIEIDNRKKEMVILFNQKSLALSDPGMLRHLSNEVRRLKFRVRERCYSRAQSKCARTVLEREKLWSSPKTEHDWSENAKTGRFRVLIERDEVAAKKLKKLLGPLVAIEVVDKLTLGQRHEVSDTTARAAD